MQYVTSSVKEIDLYRNTSLRVKILFSETLFIYLLLFVYCMMFIVERKFI